MENNYDKLDEFFRRSMQDHTPDDSWNVPSSTLFENSISKIQNDKPKWYRNKYLYFLPLFLMFTFGTYFILIKDNATSPQSTLLHEKIIDEIAQLKSENASLKTQINNLRENNSKLQENAEVLSILKDRKEIQLKSKNQTQITLFRSKSNASILNVRDSGSIMDSNQMSVSNINQIGVSQTKFKEKPMLLEDQNLNFHNDLKSITTSTLLSQLPKINYDNNLAANKPNLILLPKLELFESTILKVRKHYIGVSLGINNSWLTMNKVPKGNMEQVTEYEKAHSCYGAMLNFGYETSPRWRLVADVSYNRYVNESKSIYDFFYDLDNVYTDQNGLEMYHTNLPIMNPLGDYDANFSFRVNSTMQQNELIKEKTQTKQVLDALAINLGTDYKVLKSSKFNVVIGAGLGVATKLNLKNNFDISIYMDDKLKHNILEVTNEMKGVNPLVINGYIKVGLDYMINDRLSLGIESIGLKTITSLRNSWPNDGPKTYLNAVNTMMGMKYYW